MKNRIDELYEQIENALANDAHESVAALYAELEEHYNQTDVV